VSPQDHEYHVNSVDIQEAIAFRRMHSLHPDLVLDDWDSQSNHLCFYLLKQPIALIRIVNSIGRQLPLTSHVFTLPTTFSSIQIGRLVANRKQAIRGAISFVYRYVVNNLFSLPCAIYIPAVEGGPISIRRYLANGFLDTGHSYQDHRYPNILRILVRNNPHDPSVLIDQHTINSRFRT
jgi:hypothetical protein